MPVIITGLAQAIADHQEWAARAHNIRPVLEEIGADTTRVVDEAWSSRRSPAGEAWPPEKEQAPPTRAGTRSARPARRSAGRRLEDAHEVIVEPRSITISVPVPHASFQFFGTEAVPARNPLPVERVRGGYVIPGTGTAAAWLERMLDRIRAYLIADDGDAGGR
jgi:hypothetical protein